MNKPISTTELLQPPSEMIETLLSSNNAAAKCTARLLATEVVQTFEDFLNSEMKRGTDILNIIEALNAIIGSTMANIITIPKTMSEKKIEGVCTAFAEIHRITLTNASLKIYADRTQSATK